MVRDAVREMEQTRRHKEESTVTVYRATPEQIEKMLGGKDMSRPVGSKNKSKIKVNTDQKSTSKQDVKEVEVEAVKIIEDPGELVEQEIKPEEFSTPPRTLNHMDEFRKALRERYITSCMHNFSFVLEKEMDNVSPDTLRDAIYRIMDYCELTLRQINKDL